MMEKKLEHTEKEKAEEQKQEPESEPAPKPKVAEGLFETLGKGAMDHLWAEESRRQRDQWSERVNRRSCTSKEKRTPEQTLDGQYQVWVNTVEQCVAGGLGLTKDERK